MVVLLFLGELFLALTIALAGLVGRVLCRRPWLIEARSGHRVVERRASGWRASRVAVQQLADDVRAGAAG